MNQWNQYAQLVDERIGNGGDALHNKLIDPLIRSYTGDTAGKSVLDYGCGNAYIFNTLSNIASYIGIDSSATLLGYARKRASNGTFIEADITKPFDAPLSDIILCNMVLQYCSDISGVVLNAKKHLSTHGVCIVIVDHPAHMMFMRAQELAGKLNDKFLDSKSYFHEGKRQKKSLWGKAVLSYYHRTIATYINAFAPAFRLDQMDELSEDNEIPRILGLKWIKI